MAATKPFVLFVLLTSLCFYLSFTSTSSHSLTDIATTELDVSSSLSQALNILSFDPQTTQTELIQLQQKHLNANASLSFSIQLHSREAIHKTQHKDYKTLVFSRLYRDIARVNALNARLQLAVNGVSNIDLNPVEEEIRPESLSTPVTSGISQGSGEYFTQVGVGNPSKPYYMVLDTGSDVTWLQCNPCVDCYRQNGAYFDPTASSSYMRLTCNSQQCNSLEMSSCRQGQCLYQVNYGDGSFTFGDFVTETLSFGESGSIDHVAIGCGHDNEGLFVGAAGLLGLGGGPLSLTSQIKAASFSYCLVNRDSTVSSTLDFNSVSLRDSVTAPLSRNRKIDTFYYVGITGISVGGNLLSIPESIFQVDKVGNGGVIVDSGTAITRLQTDAYNSLRDSFVSLTKHLISKNAVALFDTCYDLSGTSSVKVPTLSFHFAGGKEWSLPSSNYLIPVDSNGTFCFALAPTTSSLSIIGNVQQQGTRVSYDLAQNLVGFANDKC